MDKSWGDGRVPQRRAKRNGDVLRGEVLKDGPEAVTLARQAQEMRTLRETDSKSAPELPPDLSVQSPFSLKSHAALV